MVAVALGLGSNRKFSGLSCEEILGGAVFALSKIVSDIEYSSVYRTKAMYVTDQEDFYNMALVGFVPEKFSARKLLKKIHRIEARFGRNRKKEIRFGPRSLDIDIEFFGAQTVSQPNLQIPHPRLKERAFVLAPLLEILANSADDINGKFFCFSRDELASSFAALDCAGVEKIISAKDFSQFVKKAEV